MVPFSDSLELHNAIILLKLARFVSSQEQRSIRKDIIALIPQNVDIRPDEWAKDRRILLKVPNLKKDRSEELLKKISQIPGIVTIIIFKKKNFDFSTTSLSELVKFTVSSVNTIERPLYIKFQAIGSIPFHKRAFQERIHKKMTIHKESNETTFNIYLECKEEQSEVLGRLGFIYSNEKKGSISLNNQETIEDLAISKKKLSVILYSPFTTTEIADFSRINLNFDFLEVIFSNENGQVPDIIKETAKGSNEQKDSGLSFKGMDKVNYKIIPSLNEFIEDNNEKYQFLGFSLHASKNTQDLKHTLKKSDKIPCIIIGNEVRGLEYSTQKMIDTFKLGTGSSEPLRASHVLAYVLGLVA